MRLKKIAAAVMAGTLSIFALTGCSTESKNYFNEVEKTAAWDGVDTKVDGSMTVNLAGEELNVNFDCDGYINQKDLKGKMTINFTSESGINIPNMEMYLDNTIAYINKDYFTGTFTQNGVEVPNGLANIPAQYIGIDSGLDKNYYEMLSTESGLLKFQKDLIGDVELDIPMTQKDREYTVNLTDAQVANLIKDIFNGGVENFDKLNTTFNLGLDTEKVSQIKAQLQSDEVKAQLNNLKDIIKDSSITVDYKFADDSLTSSINMDIKIKDMGSIVIKAQGINTKAEKKDVEIPLGRVKFTQAQYMECITDGAAVEALTEAAE